jgi:hypothetical protein
LSLYLSRRLTDSMRPFRWPALAAGAAALLVSLAWTAARGQEPAPPTTPSAADQPQPPAQTAAPPGSSSSSQRPHGHANDFLIIGTVFTDQALAFPGVHLRVRRTTEKKFRWEAYTNSRGEFAVRVPQGAEYEMVILAKGFVDQTKAVSAKSGISENNVVFQMQPVAGGKK